MSSRSTIILLLVAGLSVTQQGQLPHPGLVSASSMILAREQTLPPNDVKLINDLDSLELETIPLKTNGNGNMQLLPDFRHPSSCQLVQIVHLLKHPGCQSKAIESFACAGSCPSYVKTSTSELWQHERSCSCCQQTGLQEATFTLDCPSLEPPFRKVKTHAPVDCLCRSCTDLGRENLRAQELVEALAANQETIADSVTNADAVKNMS